MKNSNLIQARKAMGLTQEQLARKMNYRKSAVSNWENGYSVPSVNDAMKLAIILNTNIPFLFNHYVQIYHTLYIDG